MKIFSQERLEEFLLILNDNLRSFRARRWLYIIGIVIVLIIPLYFSFKALFFKLAFDDYQGPVVNHPERNIKPLEIVESKILKLDDNTYSGFARIKNINLEWGVSEQRFIASSMTLGGTEVNSIEGTTFILPASEKLIVFSRFFSEKEPVTLNVSLDQSARFIHKPNLPQIPLQISRIEQRNIGNSQYTVSALVKNNSPLNLKRIYLSLTLFDSKNNIIGVNFTTIDNIKSFETRSFQFFWPKAVGGVNRVEINPEVNVFDPNLFINEEGTSQFESID